tara:strand:+ start:3445 stop:3609 length:165 start_codon:yes stop_codon:yes gene_type:complete
MRNIKIAVGGALTVASVVGVIVGGRMLHNRYQKTIALWRNRFYDKLTEDDVAWG